MIPIDKKTFIFALLLVALFIPEAHAVTLNAGDIVKPNASSSGYYVINNTITLMQLDVNSTDALFTGLDSAWEVTDKTLTKNTPNLVLPQTSTIKNVKIFNFSSFNLTSTGKAKLYDTSGNLIDDSVPAQITSSTATSIKFNSSQNYTGNLRWNVAVTGNYIYRNWYYASNITNTPKAIPRGNISFNGTHTIFRMNIDVYSGTNKMTSTPSTLVGRISMIVEDNAKQIGITASISIILYAIRNNLKKIIERLKNRFKYKQN